MRRPSEVGPSPPLQWLLAAEPRWVAPAASTFLAFSGVRSEPVLVTAKTTRLSSLFQENSSMSRLQLVYWVVPSSPQELPWTRAPSLCASLRYCIRFDGADPEPLTSPTLPKLILAA